MNQILPLWKLDDRNQHQNSSYCEWLIHQQRLFTQSKGIPTPTSTHDNKLLRVDAKCIVLLQICGRGCQSHRTNGNASLLGVFTVISKESKVHSHWRWVIIAGCVYVKFGSPKKCLKQVPKRKKSGNPLLKNVRSIGHFKLMQTPPKYRQ